MQKVTLSTIKNLALKAKGSVDKLYLHWSASRYGQYFDDYHINIDADGSLLITTNDFTERKSHTWRRNSRAIGITLACCYNATTEDWGDYPPTKEQIESLAQVVAVLCKYLELPIDSSVVMTHAEAADLDEYGPATTCERWDMWILPGVSKGEGGNIIRGKANFYLNSGQLV